MRGNSRAAEDSRLEQQRLRAEQYRERRRRGAVLVPVEVERRDLAALEGLGMLDPGERDPQAIAAAVNRFLAGAGAVAALGDVWWPVAE
ncbi:MAG TPA: hypothetical protein VIL69_13780 [Roseomonas sp.]|jgi:hypothetical protein